MTSDEWAEWSSPTPSSAVRLLADILLAMGRSNPMWWDFPPTSQRESQSLAKL